MPLDPAYLREHATRCWMLAAQTGNPVLQKSLRKVAQRSARLALDLDQAFYSHQQPRLVSSHINKQDALCHQ
jgi:hypothetical protein